MVRGGGRRWVRRRLDCSIGVMKTLCRAVAVLKMLLEQRIAMVARSVNFFEVKKKLRQ
jgi:hypothetical protein